MPSPGRSQRNRRNVKARMFQEQKGLCHWCREPMHMGYSNGPEYATWEHLLPKSIGGPNVQSNLVLAHAKCNKLRGSKNAEVFAAELRGER